MSKISKLIDKCCQAARETDRARTVEEFDKAERAYRRYSLQLYDLNYKRRDNGDWIPCDNS